MELRDELLSLVLAGHETTAHSLAWTFERLRRNRASYDRLRELTRAGGDDGAAYIEATRNVTMIPLHGTRVIVSHKPATPSGAAA